MRRRRISPCIPFLLASLLAACGGGGGGDSASAPVAGAGPGPGPGSGGPGGSTPTYRVTLNPSTGVETNLRAVVWVGPRAVTRAEAADGATLRAAGFTSTTLETDANGGPLVRSVGAQQGQTISIIAIESEGVYNTTQFPAPQPPLNNLVEVASFGGSPVVQSDAAAASVAVGSSDLDVTVNFRRMPQIVVSMIGAARIGFDFDLPPVREIPERANPNDRSFNGPSVTMAPNRLVYVTLQYRNGSTVNMTAQPSGEFLRWEGACSGGATCSLRFGTLAGFQDQLTALIAAYMTCTSGPSTTYSGFVPGQAIAPNCTIVRP